MSLDSLWPWSRIRALEREVGILKAQVSSHGGLLIWLVEKVQPDGPVPSGGVGPRVDPHGLPSEPPAP